MPASSMNAARAKGQAAKKKEERADLEKRNAAILPVIYADHGDKSYNKAADAYLAKKREERKARLGKASKSHKSLEPTKAQQKNYVDKPKPPAAEGKAQTAKAAAARRKNTAAQAAKAKGNAKRAGNK